MLLRLPNEILVKIFDKTKLQTSRECRLLSSRFNKIIERDELHKDDAGHFIVYCDKNKISVRFDSFYYRCEKGGMPVDFQQVIDINERKIRKIRRVFCFTLENITVTPRLMEIFLGASCLRHLHFVDIERCDLNLGILGDKWTKFLTRPKNAKICMHRGYGDPFLSDNERNNKETERRWMTNVVGITKQLTKIESPIRICICVLDECQLTNREKMCLAKPVGLRTTGSGRSYYIEPPKKNNPYL